MLNHTRMKKKHSQGLSFTTQARTWKKHEEKSLTRLKFYSLCLSLEEKKEENGLTRLKLEPRRK